MSQIYKSLTSGPVPPSVPTSFVTDVNSPAIPAANVLNEIGGSVTANNANGLRTDGSSGSNTLTIQLTNRLTGTGTTVGAVTADLFSFALGATPGVYNVEAKVVGYTATGPAGTGYTVLGTILTTGAAGSLQGVPEETPIENVSLIASDVDFIMSGNNFILRVTGVVGVTLNWRVLATYTFVS